MNPIFYEFLGKESYELLNYLDNIGYIYEKCYNLDDKLNYITIIFAESIVIFLIAKKVLAINKYDIDYAMSKTLYEF